MEVKKKVMECLNDGLILHETRNDINIKNLLSTGGVSIDEVLQVLGRSKGNGYSSSPHHFDNTIDVHVVKTSHSGQRWYIKWYFVEPDSVFISVHH